MTLDLEFWLMLCSREELSFRNAHVGRHQTAVLAKVIQAIPIRNSVLDDNIKSTEKRQNFKICKPVSLSIFNLFFNKFCLFFILVTKCRFIMALAPAYDKKYP